MKHGTIKMRAIAIDAIGDKMTPKTPLWLLVMDIIARTLFVLMGAWFVLAVYAFIRSVVC